MGAEVVVGGPATMLPRGFAEAMGVRVYHTLEETITGADIIIMLRIQLEREAQNIFPSLREYAARFCLTAAKVSRARMMSSSCIPVPLIGGWRLPLT